MTILIDDHGSRFDSTVVIIADVYETNILAEADERDSLTHQFL